ncbi:MAG: hypothetical protein ABSH36_01580 [Solirubrobacteraceae bacterium]
MSEPQRVIERRRAVALAYHYREAEHLSVVQIAQRIGRAPATVRGYFYDPDASKTHAIRESYRVECKGCGAPTSQRSGPRTTKPLCHRCRTRPARKWTPKLIEAALRAWSERYGERARSTDLSTAYAKRYGGERLQRLQDGWEDGPWPSLTVVQYHFGTLTKANQAALDD